MANPLKRFLTPEAKVRLPNVDEALDTGYVLYVADDPELRDTETQNVARRIIERFNALKADSDSPDDAYLACVRSIVLSHARGIARRKRQWKDELEAAKLVKEGRLERVKESRNTGWNINGAWNLLAPSILGLAGYMSALLIGLIVPTGIAEHTGNKLPSVLLGLVFVFVGKAVSYWLYDRERSIIEAEYRTRTYHADLAYELNKLSEYHLYRERLCEAWLEYTGEAYPSTASYEMIMASDIATRRKIEQRKQVYDRTTVWKLRRIVRLFRPRTRKQRSPGDATLISTRG